MAPRGRPMRLLATGVLCCGTALLADAFTATPVSALQGGLSRKAGSGSKHQSRRSAALFSTATATTSSTTTTKKVGKDYLPEEAVARSEAAKNKFEKVKLEKCGTAAWTEIHDFSAAVRSGEYTWEELDINDADIRLKWAGFFHRRKRDPGTFMVRVKIPNGIVTSEQMRRTGALVKKYDPRIGVLDITTRMGLQLRGVVLEDASDVVNELYDIGLTCYQTGMDSVRNMVGSPIAGIDPHELVDTRNLCTELSNMLSGDRKGTPEWGNLPRKFNIAISGGRDDFAHTMINDLGMQPIAHPETGEMGFNIVVGGLFSIKRADLSLPLDLWVPESKAYAMAKAVMIVFRDNGLRQARDKARLMYLLDDWGIDKFRDAVVEEMKVQLDDPSYTPSKAAPAPEGRYEKRDVVGIHEQKQEGKSWVCVNIPAGRLTPSDCDMAADVADKYSGGEIRLTVDQHILFPNVDTDKVAEMQKMPFFATRFPVEQGALVSKMVSCTGSEFCSLGLVETKNNAIAFAGKLDAKFDFPEGAPRMHWTGCPNSCGQAQVGDIGLMGGPARRDKKAVPGVNILLGGTVGEDHNLATMHKKGVVADDEDLLPVLEELLVEKFGAVPKRTGGKKRAMLKSLVTKAKAKLTPSSA